MDSRTPDAVEDGQKRSRSSIRTFRSTPKQVSVPYEAAKRLQFPRCVAGGSRIIIAARYRDDMQSSQLYGIQKPHSPDITNCIRIAGDETVQPRSNSA